MPPPMHGVVLEVLQRVVHPTHVPLEREAEAAEVGRPADGRPRRRLLGDRERARHPAVDLFVELARNDDGAEVLPATELVRHPLSRLAGVVEVEHRGHGVDADAVDVHLLQPIQRAGDEEAPDLVAVVVEDECAPVRMLTLARVGVFVQRRSVELGERPRVLREVGGYPVDDHADVRRVQGVDQSGSRPACRTVMSARSTTVTWYPHDGAIRDAPPAATARRG